MHCVKLSRSLATLRASNIAFEYRWAGGKPDQLPELAAELARLKVDVMVTDGTPPAVAARKEASTIPQYREHALDHDQKDGAALQWHQQALSVTFPGIRESVLE
jgi:hypothetical protein